MADASDKLPARIDVVLFGGSVHVVKHPPPPGHAVQTSPYVRLDAVEAAVRRELRGDLTDEGVESVVAAVLAELEKER